MNLGWHIKPAQVFYALMKGVLLHPRRTHFCCPGGRVLVLIEDTPLLSWRTKPCCRGTYFDLLDTMIKGARQIDACAFYLPRSCIVFVVVYVALCVDVCKGCVLFDELATWCYILAHEHGEYVVGLCSIVNGYLLQ